jgi:hypothetical protein
MQLPRESMRCDFLISLLQLPSYPSLLYFCMPWASSFAFSKPGCARGLQVCGAIRGALAAVLQMCANILPKKSEKVRTTDAKILKIGGSESLHLRDTIPPGQKALCIFFLIFLLFMLLSVHRNTTNLLVNGTPAKAKKRVRKWEPLMPKFWKWGEQNGRSYATLSPYSRKQSVFFLRYLAFYALVPL